MKRIVLCWLLSCCFANTISSQAKRPLPVIDMHLHALHADEDGPPPLKMGAPFRDFDYNDPQNSFGETFMHAMKSGLWTERSVTSPTTDDSLQNMTLEVLQKRNVYAVTCGDIDMVRKWKRAAPDRIINGIAWNFSSGKRQGLTVDSLDQTIWYFRRPLDRDRNN